MKIEIKLEEAKLALLVNRFAHISKENKELYKTAINNKHGKGTTNSKHSVEWDMRYNSIYDVAEELGLLALKVPRSNLWELVFVINIEHKEIYAFMKEKTLTAVLKKDKLHYTRLFNQFNSIYDDAISSLGQSSLFPSREEIHHEDLLIQAKKMIDSCAIVPEKAFIFSLEETFIPSVKAVAYNSHNELIYENNLSHLLKVDANNILKPDKITPPSKESAPKKLPPKDTKERSTLVKIRNRI